MAGPGDFSYVWASTVAITTTADFWEIVAGSTRSFQLSSFTVGQRSELGEAQEEQLGLELHRVSGGTSGSGGQGAAALKQLAGQGGSSAAQIEVMNTTALAVGGGTSEALWGGTWQLRNPYLYVPLPNKEIWVAAGDRLALRLVDAPADSIGGTVNGTAALRGLVDIFEG